MWRLNWGADLSPRGLKNSFGMMVNYRYFQFSLHSNYRYIANHFYRSGTLSNHARKIVKHTLKSKLSRVQNRYENYVDWRLPLNFLICDSRETLGIMHSHWYKVERCCTFV